MRREFMRTTVLAMVLGGSVGCATKGYLRGQVGSVNEKVDSLAGSIEETQERTRKNETRIGQVDAKTDQVGLWAKDAQSSAAVAQGMANAAQDRANAAGSKADEAQAKADAADRAAKRLVFDIILTEDEGNFRFGRADLPDSTRARIDQLIEDLKANPKAAFVEIEGHTDAVGSPQINNRLGLARAEAVKRYLYEKHKVPLHKINVFSYGKDKPIAPNDTPGGRARNRRVVIKVLA